MSEFQRVYLHLVREFLIKNHKPLVQIYRVRGKRILIKCESKEFEKCIKKFWPTIREERMYTMGVVA